MEKRYREQIFFGTFLMATGRLWIGPRPRIKTLYLSLLSCIGLLLLLDVLSVKTTVQDGQERIHTKMYAFEWKDEPLNHPIPKLMHNASDEFDAFIQNRSRTFEDVVTRYRQKWGRHPPPGFDKWYKFAKKRSCFHFDVFDQINDDLRPFWSVAPVELRRLVKGMLGENRDDTGLDGIMIRKGRVKLTPASKAAGGWRGQEFVKMLKVFAKELPDMDIAMNWLDQPRVVVSWEDMQRYLAAEKASRRLPQNARNSFSKNKDVGEPGGLDTGEWFNYAGQQFMDIGVDACPPDSFARNPNNTEIKRRAIESYSLTDSAGIVTNFNRSSDLCTIGPLIQDKHGFLFSSSSLVASKKLVPVFGECKVNINNDILFPANMYYRVKDKGYAYDGTKDLPWEQKRDVLFWRGVTSGGTQVLESWRRLHRHRLVITADGTISAREGTQFPILVEENGNYTQFSGFRPELFSKSHFDVGFVEVTWCAGDESCAFVKEHIGTKPLTTMTEQFQNRYLVDIDGHSFSGRWHAFLKSRSLGLKATIFREWHDSRLFAWKHFVPMDNQYGDLYALMTFFMGLDDADQPLTSGYIIPGHGNLAKKIALESSEWANRVLRVDDIDIYMYRLMLEYARILDDDRDNIGYSGDGKEIS